MQVISRNQRPPAMQSVYGDIARGSKQKQAGVVRREKEKGIEGKIGGAGTDENRQNIHCHIDTNEDFNKLEWILAGERG